MDWGDKRGSFSSLKLTPYVNEDADDAVAVSIVGIYAALDMYILEKSGRKEKKEKGVKSSLARKLHPHGFMTICRHAFPHAGPVPDRSAVKTNRFVF